MFKNRLSLIDLINGLECCSVCFLCTMLYFDVFQGTNLLAALLLKLGHKISNLNDNCTILFHFFHLLLLFPELQFSSLR